VTSPLIRKPVIDILALPKSVRGFRFPFCRQTGLVLWKNKLAKDRM
jgi:hypothetical protein